MKSLKRRLLLVAIFSGACTYNRPITLAPAAGVRTYFADNHPTDVLITDTAGHSHWVHNPTLDGDTLRGVRSGDLPRPRIVIPVEAVQSLAAPHFSLGRTLGLTGAVLAAVGAAILILFHFSAQPLY